MAWQKFTRTRSVDKEKPVLTLSKSHFYFSAVAARITELKEGSRAVYHVDESNRKIGFEITSEDVSHSYSIFPKSSGKGFRCTSADMIASYDWIRKVAHLRDPSERRFYLRLEGKLWVVQLCPAFEISVPRDDDKSIPAEEKGVYRYLNAGVIVYIGKGNIRSRLRESGRNSWHFDTIEYSVVSSEDQQYQWESYWIDRYRENNNNSLPAYNAIAGRAC